MSVDRTEGRRSNHRAFRPTLDGSVGLESRCLLSNLPGLVFLRNPRPGVAFKFNQPPFVSGGKRFPVASFPRGVHVATQTAHGGASVIVAAPDGSHFQVSVTQYFPTSQAGTPTTTQAPILNQTPGAGVIQPMGTVRAYPMPGGRVGLILDGTTTQSELTISPDPFPQMSGYAHSFAYGQTNQTHILDIGQITVNSGQLAAVEGYHTAALSGPLVISGTTPVDRIAFEELRPGASITTGGDLNTLDVLNGINLNSAPGIVIGRDLNLFNVGQDVNLSNGASITIGRFLGLVLQPPKGTATGSNFLSLNQALVGTGTSTVVPSLSAYIQGNLNIANGSVFSVAQGIPNTSVVGTTPAAAPSIMLINGSLITSSGTVSQFMIPGLNTFNTGTMIVNPISGLVNSVVYRSGTNIAGFGP